MSCHVMRVLRGLGVGPLGKLGVLLVAVAFLGFLGFLVLQLPGLVPSALFGLVGYMLFPGLMSAGLALVAFSWWWGVQRSGLSLRDFAARQFHPDDLEGGFTGAPVVRSLAVLGVAVVVFFGLWGMTNFPFMEKPYFCGTACHTVMNPEWTVYQRSPHARVRCVDCHVGEGVYAHVRSKYDGLRQIVLVTTGTYSAPIPTPVHQLRPARETCEKCHWPEKFYGPRLKMITHFAEDEANTPKYTTLVLKVDNQGEPGRGIHWHVSSGVTIRYAAADEKRRTMAWVEATWPDGTTKRWENRALAHAEVEPHETRVMDCVDCHNRATHIYGTPEGAVEERMVTGEIDPTLPYIRREALAAILPEYPTVDAAMEGIEAHLWGFYRTNYPQVLAGKAGAIEQAVAALQDAWKTSVHPEMNITWGTYPSLLGHQETDGCFRCHNKDMVAADGTRVDDSCDLCHVILAHEAPKPFRYLAPAPKPAPEGRVPARWLDAYPEGLGALVGAHEPIPTPPPAPKKKGKGGKRKK